MTENVKFLPQAHTKQGHCRSLSHPLFLDIRCISKISIIALKLAKAFTIWRLLLFKIHWQLSSSRKLFFFKNWLINQFICMSWILCLPSKEPLYCPDNRWPSDSFTFTGYRNFAYCSIMCDSIWQEDTQSITLWVTRSDPSHSAYWTQHFSRRGSAPPRWSKPTGRLAY